MNGRAVEREPRAWVLNLDAENELDAGPRYAPTRHLDAIVARESRRLVGTLVAPGDVVLTAADVDAEASARNVRGLTGLAWSPTPRARRLLERAGATPVAAPEAAVLAAVNARPFAAQVRAPLVEASFAKHVATDLEQALALLGAPRGAAPDGWLVRRTFGAAGRGRRRIAPGRPDEAELAWLAAGLRRGPLVLEPWVRVTREYTRSGWVDRDGHVSMSSPCLQETTPTGAWVRTAPGASGDVAREDDARLASAFESAGRRLARAGYFGPFGIDAFRHRVPGRAVRAGGAREVLNPLSEINARFTMDWTAGMEREPALDALVSAIGAREGRPAGSRQAIV
jgi:hypothetical protein